MGEEGSKDKSSFGGQMGTCWTSQVLRVRQSTSFLHMEEEHRMVGHLLSSPERGNLDVSIWNIDRALFFLPSGTILSVSEWNSAS